jgi:DNA modification methylase
LQSKNEQTFHSQAHERWPNVKDGKRMRNKRSVWNINTAQFKGAHFAVMPVELAQTCIKAGSEEGDWILDPFSGAATTGVAALGLERNYIGVELNSEFRDISLNRLNEIDPIYSEEVEEISK